MRSDPPTDPLAGPALVRASGLVEARYAEAAGREGISVQQSRILVLVHRTPSNMIGIGAEFGLGKSTMTGVIARMEALGLVSRAPHPGDRRNLVVTATPTGAAIADRVVAAVREAVRELLSPLPQADRRELARILTVVVDAPRSGPSQST